MFVRVKSTPNSPRQSVQIVSSVRVGDKVKQKIVRYVGIAMDGEELAQLKILAEVIKAKIEAQHQPGLFPPETVAKQMLEAKAAKAQSSKATLNVDLRQMVEEQRVVLGIHEVYGAVYRQLSFDTLLSQRRYRASHEALFHCVMARIANPPRARQAQAQARQCAAAGAGLWRFFVIEAIKSWSQQHLTEGSTVISDGLACFNAVVEAACLHDKIVCGGGRASVEKPEFLSSIIRWINTILCNLKNSLRSTWHAIRPKYAQRYLAEFQYRFNRRFDLSDLIPRLACAALRTPPMPEKLLKIGLC